MSTSLKLKSWQCVWSFFFFPFLLKHISCLAMIITFESDEIIRKSHVLIIFMLLFWDLDWNKNHLISLSVAIIVSLVLKLNNEIKQLQPGELVPKQTLICQSGKRMRQFHKFMLLCVAMQRPVDKLTRQSLIVLCFKLCEQSFYSVNLSSCMSTIQKHISDFTLICRQKVQIQDRATRWWTPRNPVLWWVHFLYTQETQGLA